MSIETPNKLQYSFAGKKVLITGGGSGIGQALVSRLYNDGASVFTLEKDPESVSQLLNDFPDRTKLTAVVCDITKWGETQALIESFGPLDHLVNCAGICLISEIMDIKEDDLDKIMAVNLKSLFCTSQAVAKGMISAGKGGTIVNISSIGGHMAYKGNSMYAATKAGVIMLTKSLAVELGQHKIRVNSISPSFIDTPMVRNLMREFPHMAAANQFLLTRQPFQGKNMLDKNDVVNSILFLLSPLSSLASGMDLVLDGGITIC